MGVLEILVVVIGLMVFEVVSSVDNAVINAEVLASTTERARQWFLTWGLLFSVVAVRGLLPLVIVYATNPALGVGGAISAAFSSDPQTAAAIEHSKPLLLAGGGIYLLLLFIHWVIVEPKRYAFSFERVLQRELAVAFYLSAGIIIAFLEVVFAQQGYAVALSGAIGAATFFITTGVKSGAEAAEEELAHGAATSPWRKILYLELIDTAFSFDGVLGAFAFTTAVPLILLGNGLGVVVIRQLTIHGISRIRTYQYLTNGAMYSIALLAVVMLLDSLRLDVPFWVSPTATVSIVAYFFWRSLPKTGTVPNATN